jgi:hypothetical protein
MSSPIFCTVGVCDQDDYQAYLFHLRFDPSPFRTQDGIRQAAAEWARKFVAIDGSRSPGWLDRLRFQVDVDPVNQVLPETSGYPIARGVTFFVEKAPAGNRLLNAIQVRVRIMMLRGESVAQAKI